MPLVGDIHHPHARLHALAVLGQLLVGDHQDVAARARAARYVSRCLRRTKVQLADQAGRICQRCPGSPGPRPTSRSRRGRRGSADGAARPLGAGRAACDWVGVHAGVSPAPVFWPGNHQRPTSRGATAPTGRRSSGTGRSARRRCRSCRRMAAPSRSCGARLYRASPGTRSRAAAAGYETSKTLSPPCQLVACGSNMLRS